MISEEQEQSMNTSQREHGDLTEKYHFTNQEN